MGQTDTSDSGIDVNPPVPSIVPTPGWQTSQGQLTAIFTLVCLVLSFFGFHYTPEQMNSWADTANHAAQVIVPIVTALVGVVGYTMSRGQTHQVAMAATAAVQVAQTQAQGQILGTEATLSEPVAFGGGLSHIIGGKNWKDPDRYGNLLHIASQFGVPGAVQADKINQQIHPIDLINGLLSAIEAGKKI